MIRQRFLLARTLVPFGPDDPAPNPSPNPAPNPEPTPVFDPKNPPKFDDTQQKYLNHLMAEERRKGQAQNQALITQLETLRENVNLSEQEKVNLTEQIDQLKSAHLTDNQKLTAQIDKLKGEHQKAIEKQLKETDTYRGLFENLLMSIDFAKASEKHGAYSSEQIEAILRPWTKVIEKLGDDNKPTGERVARVKFKTKDKDGKPIELDLSVDEAVKQMKETPVMYGNLFKSDAAGGTGSNHTGIQGGDALGDLDDMSVEQYQKKRDQVFKRLERQEH